jgi:hypothetical protein
MTRVTPTEAIPDLDSRLAAIGKKITDKTKLHRGTALQAAFSKEAAAGRTALKAEIDKLRAEQAELMEARSVAMEQIDADEQLEVAAREHAQREAAAAKRRESNARVYQAAEAMESAVEGFLAAARALHAERTLVTSATNEHLSMVPRRVIKGMVDKLKAEGQHFNNFSLQDGSDHWSVGLAAIGLLKKQVAP